MGVADQRDAERRSRRGTARRSGPTGRTPRSGRAATRGRARRPRRRRTASGSSRKLARRRGDHLLRPLGGERRAARELLEREHVRPRRGRGCPPGRPRSWPRPAPRRRRARRRSRRGRRGTTAPPRPASWAAAMTASKAWRLPWMSEAMATRMAPTVSSVRSPWRLPIALVTALVVAEAAVVLMRPRDRGPDPVPVRGASLLQSGPAGARRRRSGRDRPGSRLGQMAIGIGALVLLVRRPPERLTALPRPVAGRRGDGRGRLRGRRPRAAAAARDRPRAGQGRRAGHPGLDGLGGRRGQGPRPSGRSSPGAGGALLVVGHAARGRGAGGSRAPSSSWPSAR